jgi:hypothetical protein
MTSPNESAVLAWSKTIDAVRFRAFAFPEGCDDPECEFCRGLEGSPVWAAFMRPRPLRDETTGLLEEPRDEWCLCMIAWGNGELADNEHFENVIEQMDMLEEFQQEFWRKVVALIGVEWSVVTKRPYEFAVRHKLALNECMSGGLVTELMERSTPEQLRKVRDAKKESGGRFGEAFGQLFWELIGKYRDQRRGS